MMKKSQPLSALIEKEKPEVMREAKRQAIELCFLVERNNSLELRTIRCLENAVHYHRNQVSKSGQIIGSSLRSLESSGAY
jgi:hypothetical protein